MANTIIRIKTSTATDTPAPGIVSNRELAYSYSSNTLFIGLPDSANVVAVGGKYWMDTVVQAFAKANAATGSAAADIAIAAYAHANQSFFHANAAFDAANSAFLEANTVNGVSISAFAQANIANSTAIAAFEKANTGGGGFTSNTANAAFYHANAAFDHANSAFDKANNNTGAIDTANANIVILNSNVANVIGAVSTANTNITNLTGAVDTANGTIIAAFTRANAALNTTTGGTVTGDVNITGDVDITGNLNVTGNFITFDTINYTVQDALIMLANNNLSSDVTDIGVVAPYQNSGAVSVYTGFYREHTTKEWYLFKEYNDQFLETINHIDPAGNNFTLDVLNAVIKTSNLILNGANATVWIGDAYAKANTANDGAVGAFTRANDNLGAIITSNANIVILNSNVANVIGAVTTANTNITNLTGAVDTANGNITINSDTIGLAFDKANTANVNAGNATFLTTGTVPSARIAGSYTGITGVGTIAAGTWNGDVITVPYGGTGLNTLTANGVLIGNGTSQIKTAASSTEGHVLQINASGVPTFDMLDGGSF